MERILQTTEKWTPGKDEKGKKLTVKEGFRTAVVVGGEVIKVVAYTTAKGTANVAAINQKIQELATWLNGFGQSELNLDEEGDDEE